MHDTPDAKIEGYQRLAGFGIENCSETAVRSEIMIQVIGTGLNGKGNAEGQDCYRKTSFSHGDSPFGLRLSITV